MTLAGELELPSPDGPKVCAGEARTSSWQPERAGSSLRPFGLIIVAGFLASTFC